MGSEPEPKRPVSDSTPRPKGGWRRRIWLLAWVLVVTMGCVEGGLRLLVDNGSGWPTLLGTRLLPRPTLLPEQEATLARPPESFRYYLPDSELGWTLKPNGESPDGLYHANALGLRTGPARPMPGPEHPKGERILLVGDSYTHGDEVSHADSWAGQLAEQLGPDHEVWNAGVSGYGTDQALLRWRRLAPGLKPTVAVLGIYREDLLRNLTCFRPVKHAFTSFPFGKPTFTVEDGRLRLHHHPVTPPERVREVLSNYDTSPLSKVDRMHDPEEWTSSPLDVFMAHRLWRSRRLQARFYDRHQGLVRGRGEGVVLAGHLAKSFVEEARDAGVRPLIVILPGGPELGGYGAGGKPPMRHLMQVLDEFELPYVDAGPALFEALGDQKIGSLYARDGVGHPNRAGSTVIARVVAEALPPR